MTPDQRKLILKAADMYGCAETSWRRQSNSDDLIAYVDQMLAQARADGMETAAKICDERAEWLRSNGHTLKAEQSEALAAAIRARKDA